MKLTTKQQRNKAENFATATAGIVFILLFIFSFLSA